MNVWILFGDKADNGGEIIDVYESEELAELGKKEYGGGEIWSHHIITKEEIELGYRIKRLIKE